MAWTKSRILLTVLGAEKSPSLRLRSEIGHRAATLCHIGHIAVQLGERLKWDTAKERFIGNEGADALLTRRHREPWGVPGC